MLRLSVGVTSEEAFEIRWREERCGAAFGAISRSGESSSDDDKSTEVVGAAESGDPSDRLDRKPAWNRLERGLMSIEGSGGVGTGDELPCRDLVNERVGGSSVEEASGVEWMARGVAWNSARVPFSVSSFQRTPLFNPFAGDIFFGVKVTPFLAPPIFRRLGDAFNGEDMNGCGGSSRLGLGNTLNGDGPSKFAAFLCFGVPDFVGGNASVTGRPPSGLITCEAAVEQEVTSLLSKFFAA